MHKADFRLIVHGLDTHQASFLLEALADGGFTEPIVVDDLSQALERATTSSRSDPKTTIALLHGGALLNTHAVEEMSRAVMDPAIADLGWLALASDGVTFDGEVVDTGNYLNRAATPAAGPMIGIQDAAPALVLLDPEALVRTIESLSPMDEDEAPGGDSEFGRLLRAGWESGHPSYFSRHLRYSINTPLSRERARRGYRDPEAWRPADLSRCRPDPSLTIAIRTTLSRPYLLRRTVASAAVAAARRPVESVLIVGSVEPDALEETCAELRESFPGLNIQSLVTKPVDSSRTTNLLAAIDTASTDYIWFVDDDDMASPHSIESIKDAIHAGDRPLVFGASEAYTETWADDTRPLLMWSQKTETYEPKNVLAAFTGTNSLPICSMVIPVELARTRLRPELLRHDLGEDYTLLLLMLTAPGATYTRVATDIAHISLRPNSDSVVTYEDRTPWLHNLSGFMADLYADPLASSQLAWEFGEYLRQPPDPEEETAQLLQRIADLLRERAELEQALANMRDWASTVSTQASPPPPPGRTAKLKRLVPPRLRPLARRVYGLLRR